MVPEHSHPLGARTGDQPAGREQRAGVPGLKYESTETLRTLCPPESHGPERVAGATPTVPGRS